MKECLAAYLKQQGAPFELIEKARTVHTADAAAAAGVDLTLVTKSLVCLAPDRRACVAIIPGDHHLDFKALAKALNLKKLRLCPLHEAHRYSGYEPGATPPVHYRKVAAVVMDRSLLNLDWLYGGGGSNEYLVKLRPADVIRLNDALVATISSREA